MKQEISSPHDKLFKQLIGEPVGHHNRIGDHVHIAPGVHLGGEVSIGQGALVASERP